VVRSLILFPSDVLSIAWVPQLSDSVLQVLKTTPMWCGSMSMPALTQKHSTSDLQTKASSNLSIEGLPGKWQVFVLEFIVLGQRRRWTIWFQAQGVPRMLSDAVVGSTQATPVGTKRERTRTG